MKDRKNTEIPGKGEGMESLTDEAMALVAGGKEQETVKDENSFTLHAEYRHER